MTAQPTQATPLAVVPDMVAPSGLDNASATIGQIAAALSKAQGAFGKVVKDKKADVKHKSGGSHSYQYATLAGVLEAVREPLSTNGITFLQPATVTDRAALVRTVLIHADSGEWLADPGMPMPVNGGDAQAVGSAITYARRYGLTSLLGIAQEDDDGAAAKASPPQRREQQQRAATPTTPAAPAKLTIEQTKALEAKFIEAGLSPADAKANTKNANPGNYAAAMKHAEALLAKRKATDTADPAPCTECHGTGYNPKSEAEPCVHCDGRGFEA